MWQFPREALLALLFCESGSTHELLGSANSYALRPAATGTPVEPGDFTNRTATGL